MRAFTYVASPARVVFGPDAVQRLPDELEKLPATRALVISTPGQRALAVMTPKTFQDLRAGNVPFFVVGQDVRRVVVANFEPRSR